MKARRGRSAPRKVSVNESRRVSASSTSRNMKPAGSAWAEACATLPCATCRSTGLASLARYGARWASNAARSSRCRIR
ncbi:hypothetical protein G6F45_014251 [Rhizopus arrhizus]|nr:hypothetical protein G6F45_014251 [Rhizopus arrhizus]